jgi:APA family basic amino acid/polyamine antiporter
VAFVAATIGAIFMFRWRSPTSAAYRPPGYPVTPLLFLVLIALVLILLAVDNPLRVLIGVAVVALDAPVYRLMPLRGKPPRAASPSAEPSAR